MKILVVDDEHFACAALEKLVNDYFREQNIPVSCLTFEDAVLAMEYIGENEADLLLTDIKMPGVDGLKLAETVQMKRPDMATVVISGYADFTYAQTALKCEVSDYLLKPISRKQIYSCLEEQVRRFEHKQKKRTELETARKHSIYHHISSGSIFDCEEWSEMLQTEVKETDIVVMAEFFCKESFHTCDRKYFEECAGMRGIQTVLAWNPGGTIVLTVFYTEMISSETLRDRVLKQCNGWCKNMIKESPGRDVATAVSGTGTFGKLHELFRQCAYAMNVKIISPQMYLFDYLEVAEKANRHTAVDSSMEHEMWQSFEFMDQELSKEIIDRQMRMLVEKKDVSLWILTDFITRIQAVLNKVIYKMNMESDSQIEYIPEISLGQFQTMEEMKQHFHSHIDRIYFEAKEGCEAENVVDRLVKYVKEHYFLNISLAETAQNMFYMNPSYLSRLFKAKMGISFSKFLLEYRLKKAMEYFETNPDISVQEAASLTGFSDGSYFVKQFKKFYGETPGFYQKHYKNESGSRQSV